MVISFNFNYMKKYNLYRIIINGKCRNCGANRIEEPFTIAFLSDNSFTDIALMYKIRAIKDGEGKNIYNPNNYNTHICDNNTLGVFDVHSTIIKKIGNKEIDSNFDYLIL